VSLVTDEAVCVRAWDWSETSQTLRVFTRSVGMVRCVAKGAKRAEARFSGGVELMTRAEIVVSTRALERGGESLATLASWDLLETFYGARSSLHSFHAGMAMLDLTQHAIHDALAHPGAYDALVAGLRMLGDAAGDRAGLLLVAWAMLADTGHQPHTGDENGAAMPRADVYGFSPRLGVFVPEAAHPAKTEFRTHPLWRVRAETVDLLREVDRRWASRGEHDDPRAVVTQLPPAGVERAMRMLLSYFREVFGVDPSALRMFLAMNGANGDATPG